jgi:hypothetical protein
LLDFSNLRHNPSVTAYPTFPELSRSPTLRTRGSTIDPTLRDTMDNGMETTRAKFTRRRRQWSWGIDFLTNEDVEALESFVLNIANYGANIFLFQDPRNQDNPQTYTVRFSVIPAYLDAGWIDGEYRQNCTFEIREV